MVLKDGDKGIIIEAGETTNIISGGKLPKVGDQILVFTMPDGSLKTVGKSQIKQGDRILVIEGFDGTLYAVKPGGDEGSIWTFHLNSNYEKTIPHYIGGHWIPSPLPHQDEAYPIVRLYDYNIEIGMTFDIIWTLLTYDPTYSFQLGRSDGSSETVTSTFDYAFKDIIHVNIDDVNNLNLGYFYNSTILTEGPPAQIQHDFDVYFIDPDKQYVVSIIENGYSYITSTGSPPRNPWGFTYNNKYYLSSNDYGSFNVLNTNTFEAEEEITFYDDENYEIDLKSTGYRHIRFEFDDNVYYVYGNHDWTPTSGYDAYESWNIIDMETKIVDTNSYLMTINSDAYRQGDIIYMTLPIMKRFGPVIEQLRQKPMAIYYYNGSYMICEVDINEPVADQVFVDPCGLPGFMGTCPYYKQPGDPLCGQNCAWFPNISNTYTECPHYSGPPSNFLLYDWESYSFKCTMPLNKAKPLITLDNTVYGNYQQYWYLDDIHYFMTSNNEFYGLEIKEDPDGDYNLSVEEYLISDEEVEEYKYVNGRLEVEESNSYFETIRNILKRVDGYLTLFTMFYFYDEDNSLESMWIQKINVDLGEFEGMEKICEFPSSENKLNDPILGYQMNMTDVY